MKNYTILSNEKWGDRGKKKGKNEKVHERKQTGEKLILLRNLHARLASYTVLGT